MSALEDHPLRYQLANELHARPFPAIECPSRAVYLAIKEPKEAVGRDRERDRAHLLALLDRFGAQHPQPDATHFYSQLGKHKIKWESHTEFVTYTVFMDGLGARPFDPADFEVFPSDWLADAPGSCITSAHIRVVPMEEPATVAAAVAEWFVPESVTASKVLDGDAVVAGDFRIDSAGHMRFAVFANPSMGTRRAGRVVQRVCEIETYKAMSMLGLSRARALSSKLGEIDRDLTALVGDMTGQVSSPDETLKALLAISAELESMLAQSSFRFGATGAYEALVNQRIQVLREERFEGRQTLQEFMTRRFDPAMRTVKASERRMAQMAERAIRAGDLLRTRVDVERSAQNQALLASMDKRADLQLRLQKTVEGLSVVAISYYAVNLVAYMLAPVAEGAGLSKIMVTAIATPVVVLAVWLMIHQIRKSMD